MANGTSKTLSEIASLFSDSDWPSAGGNLEELLAALPPMENEAGQATFDADAADALRRAAKARRKAKGGDHDVD